MHISPVTLTPAHWVDIRAVRGTPVVILAGPPVKVDQQLPVLDIGYGSHGNHGGVEPVLGLQSHARLEHV